MALINDLLSDLTLYSPSQIRPLVAPVIADMGEADLADEALNAKIREALEKSQYPFIAQEYAEIKLHSAVAMAARKRFYEAKVLFEEALARLDSDPHCRALALWMMGLNALEMQDYSYAFQYWMTARSIFEDILAGKIKLNLKKDMGDWYRLKLFELNRLMAAECIQEIYSWFGVYEPGHLEDETQVFSQKIFELIAQRKNHEAHQVIERVLTLAEMNNDYRQTREILVLCATAKYLLGATQEAAAKLSQALQQLEPRSQRMAVATWLLGLSLWRLPQQRDEGILNLQRALDQFKELRTKADQKHLVPVVQWYDEKIKIMQGEIAGKQKEWVGLL